MNDEEKRPEIKSLADYLSTLKETRYALRWYAANVLTTGIKKWILRIVTVILLVIGLGALEPFIMAFIFKGLLVKDKQMVTYAIMSLTVVMLLRKFLDMKKEQAREHFFAESWASLNRRIEELFYGMSVGQHSRHSTKLDVAYIDKARSKILNMQHVLMFDGLTVFSTLLISISCLYIFSWMAGLIMTFILAVYVVWSLFINVKVMQEGKPLESAFRRLGNRVTEHMNAVAMVRSNAMELDEVERNSKEFGFNMQKNTNLYMRILNMTTLRGSCNTLSYSAVVAIGAMQVWNGQYSMDMLYPLLMWARGVSDNIWRMGEIEQQVNWHLPSIVSMTESLSMKPDVVVPENPEPLCIQEEFEIVFDNVSYSYPGNGKVPLPVLEGISFTIAPGERVALIGPSGAGKSTIMSLMLRHMDPTSGRITVGGKDLRELDLNAFLGKVGYIPQRPVVFGGTLKDALLYGVRDQEKPGITDERIEEVMELMQINFGARLTDGIYTRVGKGGLDLSGGQNQRVAIGTAVMKSPWIMAMDESTSSLDPETEERLQEGFEIALSQGTSALVIAHRLSTVQHLCDRFIVLKPADKLHPGENQIEAVGSSFEELWECSPTFRRLYAAQNKSTTIVMGEFTV